MFTQLPHIALARQYEEHRIRKIDDPSRWRIWAGIFFLVSVFGCSGSATYPVSGTVKLKNGHPLPGGLVVCEGAAQPARGTISSDGTFRLGTFERNDGALPGVYKVLVIPAVPDDILNDPVAVARYRSAVDSRYQNVQTTPLEFTVKDDGSTTNFDIVLE
jgi:hypothetical protein